MARAVAIADDAASFVTALSIVPGAGRADLVIAVSGDVRVEDFVLESPHRVVIDLAGARVGAALASYDRVPRAGITNVRVSQFRANVVRVVLDVDRDREYSVVRGEHEVRVSVAGATNFAAWPAGSAAAAAGDVAASAASAVSADTARPRAEAPAEPPATRRAERGERVDEEALDRDARPVARAAATRTVASTTASRRALPRMTVTYTDADIRDVIAAVAAFSGRTIVVGKDVQGNVTAEIKDLPWDVALRAILGAQGLAATEDSSGVITVDSFQNILQKQQTEPVTTQVVSVNYAHASSLVETVRGLLSREGPTGQSAPASAGTSGTSGGAPAGAAGNCIVRGAVAADSGTNSLLVTEVASRMPGLLDYVRQLDVRTPQVALKAKIISVNRTATEQLGVAYDLGSKDAFFNTLAPRNDPTTGEPSRFESEVLLGGEALAGISNASRKYKNGAALNLLFSAALGKYSLTSFIDALRETNLADLQAEPSIVTLDNREAEILVGQEIPIRVIDAGSAGVVGQPARATVQFREVGIILKVTPHVTSNRQVRLSVHAEQSRLNIVGGDLGFFTDKSRADNQVLVNDGETAVIGGLTQTQVTKNRSGIPFLSELPLIGRLFSQTETREEKRDLLVLITPHVLDQGEVVRPSGSNR
jgi:type IV pilus assembly protein PilQ